MEWILVLLMYTADKEPVFIDKVAVYMKGPMSFYCRKDKDGNYVLKKPLEGTDKHIVYNQCVTVKHWRGE